MANIDILDWLMCVGGGVLTYIVMSGYFLIIGVDYRLAYVLGLAMFFMTYLRIKQMEER